MKNLRKYLQEGANKYYNFLSSTGKGLEEIRVRNISKDKSYLRFMLNGELLSTDFLVLKIKDLYINLSSLEEMKYYDKINVLEIKIDLDKLYIDHSKFKQLKYDLKEYLNQELKQAKQNNTKSLDQTYLKQIKQDLNAIFNLEYSPYAIKLIEELKDRIEAMLEKNDSTYSIFIKIKEFIKIFQNEISSSTNYKDSEGIDILKDISLFIDLKFLVRNVYDFLDNENYLGFPSSNNSSITPIVSKIMNNEQKKAIKGILDSNISYIWGVSGSGKTQVVLLNAILSLIQSGKKVLVLAPTNSALEQVFIALIENFDKIKIPRELLLRLGLPSNSFLDKYFDTCENKNEDSNIFGKNFKDRMEIAQVIGITLDGFIKRYMTLSKLKFSHIFLDECGFSPLIKLIPPLSLNIPITLLGDHKQLRPVCLMGEDEIKNKNIEVCTWNLSVLFIESLFNDYKSLHSISNSNNMNLSKIKMFSLNKTHRYGNNLAEVLDRFVYKNGLTGLGSDTKIYYIDSGTNRPEDNQNNTSNNEANIIKDIVKHFNDYAVITPFRNQAKTLAGLNIDRNKIFTIHTSQGREFDTVIFSPVKLNFYLNDSKNLNALHALNVVVSRLKKELIIVCDCSFWLSKQDQFLSALLKIAEPYRF